MKVCVIGGTGHIGRFLTPFLVEDGHDVLVATSGRTAVPEGEAWKKVRFVRCGYARGDVSSIAFLDEELPEVIIDILGGDVPMLYETARSYCKHLIVCGSVWMFGTPRIVPTPDETQAPCEFEGYACRYREMQEIKARARSEKLPFTAIMPPNICGPGKIPLECMGGRSLEVHQSHQRGEPVALAAPGSHLIGPCDAEDIGNAFRLAVAKREAASDQIFNVGSAYALTADRFVEVYGEIYGVKLPVHWVSWEQFSHETVPDRGGNYHFDANMCPDISKIHRCLGYVPKHTPEQTLARAVEWMFETGLIPRKP